MLLSLITEFSVFMPLREIVPGNSWLGTFPWRTAKLHGKWKQYFVGDLETLIVPFIKWRGMVEIKHRLYICCFNYALSKVIVDNGLVDLWRRENPDYSEFTCYDRSSGTRSRIDRSILIWKLQAIPRLITQWYPLLIIIMLSLLTDSPDKLKLEKIYGTLIILFYVSVSFPQLQSIFLLKI